MSHSRSAAAPSVTATGAGVSVPRRFTEAGSTPSTASSGRFATPSSATPRAPRSSSATSSSPSPGLRTPPTSWPRSTSAVSFDSDKRESSVKQMIGRVAGTIAGWGREAATSPPTRTRRTSRTSHPHPVPPDGGLQLTGLVQRGLRGDPVFRLSFILVEDELESILAWNTKEGKIFRGGRAPASTCRASARPRSTSPRAGSRPGRSASCAAPMHGRHDQVRRQDAAGGQDGRAGRRPSRHPRLHLVQGARGGEGRRAARRRLRHAVDSEAFASIQYQNANNSVRVTDEFMEGAERGEEWS